MARVNRVYKSLHKPMTYLGVDRGFFFVVCGAAVGTFNLFDSLLAGVVVFVGGYALGVWITDQDPAFLKIVSKKYNVRYDAAKQAVPNVEIR